MTDRSCLRRIGVPQRILALLCKASIAGVAAAQVVATPARSEPRQSGLAEQASPRSPEYAALQQRLGRGWNTWDARSVAAHVLLPQGLVIRVGMKYNTTESDEAYLRDVLIGRLEPGAEQVTPGPHAWDGSYTDLHVSWKGQSWRIQSGHDGADLALLVTPLPSSSRAALAPTAVFSVNYLWNRPGAVVRRTGAIEATSPSGITRVYCTCETDGGTTPRSSVAAPVDGPYFAGDLARPVAVSTGHPRTLAAVQAVIEQDRAMYEHSLSGPADTRPIVDAIETTLGWDTTYEPEKQRVFSPVSRVWSANWGGYVLFDWDTFFAATMASVGNRDLAYADAMETLRESTPEGFIPNYARAGNWKSFDRSEPPVGAITVLGLYRRYHELWLLRDAFPALLRWNEWWAQHRDLDGYLAWGSDGENPPGNLDDGSRGKQLGAVLESGLDNSPMYDNTIYDSHTHLLEFADVGLMSLYIADCEALASIADELHRSADAHQVRGRAEQYKRKLQTLWSPEDGIFLNKDLHTNQFSHRLSPTNFYPMLAHTATSEQAQTMVQKHLLNPKEFWGEWVLPSIAYDDPAFKDQNYWRGRIWGPMNYLVYLGLRNYNIPDTRSQLAAKSNELFLREWRDQGHVHENYNAILGTGDDVANSDRFYHWGALLGYVEYLEKMSHSLEAQ